MAVIEKFKKSLDQGGDSAALVTDLSKAFDCLPHDPIIVKLHAYGFDKASLGLNHSYFTGRYQRVKVNDSCSLWSLITCDMFFMIDNIDIASYADDTTPYSVGKSQCDLETKLQKPSAKLFKWLHENG